MPILTGQPISASCATTIMNNLLVMGPNILASSVNVNASSALILTNIAFNVENSSGVLNAASSLVVKNALLNFVASTGFILGLNNSSGLVYNNALLAASSAIDSLIKQGQQGLLVSN